MDELDQVIAWEGVTLKQGDILIVRTGFTEELGAMDASQQEKALGTHQTCGVEGNEASARWHWNHHFAAVAGDAIAYETIPPLREDGSVGGIDELGEYPFCLCLSQTYIFSESCWLFPCSSTNQSYSLAPVLPCAVRNEYR